MEESKSVCTWTIITNLLIVVGVGKGISLLGLSELFMLPQAVSKTFEYSFNAAYNHRLETGALVSLIGQLALISTYFIRKEDFRFLIKRIGIVLLWAGLAYLSINFSSDSRDALTLITGIPFCILSILLFFGY